MSGAKDPGVARDRSSEAKIPRKLSPYLSESGWIRSHTEQASVDADGRPLPWYSYAAIDFLQERVRPVHRVFEFGGGNSTLWWALHAAHVTAVEHDPDWAAEIRGRMPENVRLLETPLERNGAYCRTPENTDGEYEIVVVDGRDRVNCARNCLQSLSEDGVVVWDDSQRSRYRDGIAFLTDHGFRRLRFTGLGPIVPNPGETSIFYRSVNCFEI